MIVTFPALKQPYTDIDAKTEEPERSFSALTFQKTELREMGKVQEEGNDSCSFDSC